jgi:NitT/TauT family transport system substrate-binding protein
MFIKCRRVIYLLLILVAGLLAACAAPEADPDPVSIRLKWEHQAQFAGIYVAEQEGYYAEENLDVTIEPLDMDRHVTTEYVLNDENDFALGAPEELMIAREKGHPVKSVAVIYKIVPLVYMAPAETGIESPHDFSGKTVALSPGQGTYLYEAIMGELDLERGPVNEIDMPSWDVLECWEAADVCPGYAISDIPYANQNGVTVEAIWPGEYGVPFYGDVLFTTDAFIEENPDVVARFVRATLKGWQKAIEAPAVAADAVPAFAPDADRGVELASVEASIPLIDTGEDTIGWMRGDIWEEMQDILMNRGLMQQTIDLDAVYTNEFVEDVQP